MDIQFIVLFHEGDDEASETNQSAFSSTISNASTGRLSTASTQRDEYLQSRLTSTFMDPEYHEYTTRVSPLSARQRLLNLVARLVPEEREEQEREKKKKKKEKEKEKEEEEKEKEPRTRTFVVGMKNGEVITETFEEKVE
ncbi:hypothetical protein CKK34_3533 [Yarrowia sp. E02]|nr:hypothetical protein CKK34_3533 [Yarrowia sp. E02]